jgi:hypothetical protein
MALRTLLLAACPYLRPPDFREPFFFAAMKFLLLQFRHEIATQGCRQSGADPEDRLHIFSTQEMNGNASVPLNHLKR